MLIAIRMLSGISAPLVTLTQASVTVSIPIGFIDSDDIFRVSRKLEKNFTVMLMADRTPNLFWERKLNQSPFTHKLSKPTELTERIIHFDPGNSSLFGIRYRRLILIINHLATNRSNIYIYIVGAKFQS